jgi:phosphoglucosamine mutase
MSRQYFGTDGVRGRVGTFPLTVDFTMRLASAVTRVLDLRGTTVLIGCDTRASGPMFEAALQAGFVAAGVDVRRAGVLPTPGVSHLVGQLGCSLGVVISASHNLYGDNGIKFFNAAGGKLDDHTERLIEAALDEPILSLDSDALGTTSYVGDAVRRYQEFAGSVLPDGARPIPLKIVVDCAHGATYHVAPQVLAGIGVKEVLPIGVAPDGRNINDGCGSTAPQLLCNTVRAEAADLGIAFDGDGDRLVVVDRTGTVIDGDQLLYILACHRHRKGRLTGPVVGTVMSNMGLAEALTGEGIEFLRARVGDRYVLELLQQSGGTLGGENSGHILCLDVTPTGDALVAAVLILSILAETGSDITELAAPMPKYTQVLRSVPVSATFDLTNQPAVTAAHEAALKRLGDTGRIVLRASGTEPVVRVMVEAHDPGLADALAGELVDIITAAH